MSSNPSAARNIIRIFQTHDAAGRPAPAEFVQAITHRNVLTLGASAMEFLRPLSPRQTKDAGVFTYTDPARGSGWLRLEHFLRSDAERIQELVRMAEIEAAVGPEPRRNADIRYGNAIALRSNNPWVVLVFGAIMMTFGVILVSSAGGVEETVIYLIMGILMGLTGIALLWVGGVRLPWWTRARRYARENGGEIPSDLKGL